MIAQVHEKVIQGHVAMILIWNNAKVVGQRYKIRD